MKIIFHEDQRLHDPKHYLSSGAVRANPEVPGRIDALLAGGAELGLDVVSPDDNKVAPIAAIHSSEYLTFLKNIYGRWQRIEGASEEVIPNIHPDRRNAGYPKSAVGQAGYHMTDTSCPISDQTWHSAYWAAQSAVSAADQIIKGDTSAYALCRPPGHHAFPDMAGGFCFLNNTAIAAQRCLSNGLRPAIVDVDLHHGNGTQGVFYNRSDVLTVSVHADPERYYPFFWGYAQERGAGEGQGSNLNLPIPRGSGDDVFQKALSVGLQRVRDFGANVLVVALGLDAFEGDPFGGLSVTTPGFSQIAAACAGLGLPTIIVQEGGYLCPELGENLKSFLGGFLDAHSVVGR
ncbi:MAG: histone deacetylase family protein [Rhodospirillaceae bacterium]|nr:histone deacetylase family protein [Rhodospirillaceae bacterium]MBL6931175.1 histone deacetylase family protein [Rhodospirillales bacterium]